MGSLTYPILSNRYFLTMKKISLALLLLVTASTSTGCLRHARVEREKAETERAKAQTEKLQAETEAIKNSR